MSQFELKVANRKSSGKEAAKIARRSGEIPAVLYGHKEEPKNFTVNAREYADRVSHHGTKSMVILTGDGGGETAFIKAVQKNHVKGEIYSLDFLRVSRGEKITVAVPVVLEGESIDVKSGDGILVQGALEIQITATPDAIPDAIHVDVSGLELEGAALHAGEISLPQGVELASDSETSIAAVNRPDREETDDIEGAQATAEASQAVPAENGGPQGGGEGLQSGHNRSTSGKSDGVEHN